MDAEQRARAAYAVYATTTNFKDFRGFPMSTWEELPQADQASWVKVASEVIRCEDEPPAAPISMSTLSSGAEPGE